MAAPHAQLLVRLRWLVPVSAEPGQRAAIGELARLLGGAGPGRRGSDRGYQLLRPKGEALPLPAAIASVLERVAELLARGEAVSVVPVGRELTSQEAADLLNISRQYLVRLLDGGWIPCSRTGKHRRLRIEDVSACRQKRGAERRSALRDLTGLTEDFCGYDTELKSPQSMV
jgi:excisionase family DNA binding protein